MNFLSFVSTFFFGVFITSICGFIWPDTISPSPSSGERGSRRMEARKKSALFARVEILVRVLAGHLADVRFFGARSKLEKKLIQAGRPLGMDSNDFVALSIITATGACFLGAILCAWMGKSAGAGAILGFVFGATIPHFKVDELAQRRRILVGRGLPYAVDLAALSLEAGLDFTGAITQVISQLKQDNPIRFEFEHLLRKISLGWSRQDALIELARRIPTIQVRQFVNSVIQAEQRGTPLARVLSTQAEVMRTKRSQAAEQAAARAAILILGPLMLIFACVFIILLGPFAIKFIRGEMF